MQSEMARLKETEPTITHQERYVRSVCIYAWRVWLTFRLQVQVGDIELEEGKGEPKSSRCMKCIALLCLTHSPSVDTFGTAMCQPDRILIDKRHVSVCYLSAFYLSVLGPSASTVFTF